MARGAKDKAAELLFHKYLILHEGYKRHEMAKAISSSFGHRVDILSCDIVCIKKGRLWFIQVTTQSGLNKRRRRLEKICWKPSNNIRVSLVSHEPTDDPANRTRKFHYFRVEDYLGDCKWAEPISVGPWNRKEVEAVKIKIEEG